MKVWPIDPLVPRNLRLEVPEKLKRGSFSNQSPPGEATLPNCGEHLRAQTTAARPRGKASTGLVTQGMVTTSEIGQSAANSPPRG
jgi:hypothetical protein